jgi:hypothetical protein
MGLDISVYKGLIKADVDESLLENEDFEPEGDDQVRFYINPDDLHTVENINPNFVYEYEKSFGFRAGSYSSYNHWREQLAKLAGYPATENYEGHQKHSATVWENPIAGAFLEIINFSDCEGVIGEKNSKKLAIDFAKYQEAANNFGDKRFLELYNTWREAFEWASNNGCVEFH